MLAVITIRTKVGYGPQKVISKQLVNITKRRFGMFANESTTWDFQEEKVWKHLSAREEGMITPIHPRQTLNNAICSLLNQPKKSLHYHTSYK